MTREDLLEPHFPCRAFGTTSHPCAGESTRGFERPLCGAGIALLALLSLPALFASGDGFRHAEWTHRGRPSRFDRIHPGARIFPRGASTLAGFASLVDERNTLELHIELIGLAPSRYAVWLDPEATCLPSGLPSEMVSGEIDVARRQGKRPRVGGTQRIEVGSFRVGDRGEVVFRAPLRGSSLDPHREIHDAAILIEELPGSGANPSLADDEGLVGCGVLRRVESVG